MEYTEEQLQEWRDEYGDDHVALAIHLDVEPSELCEAKYVHYGMRVYELGQQAYAVGDDCEADSAWEDVLDNWFDEIVLPQVPQHLQMYIDRQKWCEDAEADGRGHALSSYDGEECSEVVGGTEWYIYRINR